MYNTNFINRRQLSPDGDGGGATPFVSLEDIDEITPAEEVEKQKAADLEKAAADKKIEDDKAAEAQKAIDDAAAAEAAKDKTPNKEPEDKTPEGGEPGDEDDDNFWADVDKLRGEAIEVEFGDVDPVSPEGVLIYEKAVRADEVAKFENYIKETSPRAHAYLTHILDGGKDEDFFKIAGQPVTLPTEAELENSVDLQKDIVTRNLKAKGNNDKVIERAIKGAIEDDELEEMSKEALKEEAKREADAVEAVRKSSEAETQHKAAKIKEMSDWVGNVVTTGKIDNIVIPEKDRTEFAKFFNSSIRIEGNEFVSVTKVSNDTITKLMKEKFFSFKNGDISGLIEKAAATVNTKRLQRNIVTTQKKPLGAGQKGDTGLVTMADMDE